MIKTGALLFMFAFLVVVSVGVGYADAPNSGKSLRKLLYAIRKQTLTDLTQYAPPGFENRKRMKRLSGAVFAKPESPLPDNDQKALADLGFAVTGQTVKGQPMAMLHESKGNYQGGGIYLFRKPANRCGILMAPHGFFDVNTSRISVNSFFATNANALLINSAHRYTGNRKAGFDKYGTDLAHRSDNYFFAVFEGVLDQCKTGTVIQLHGYDRPNAQQTKNLDVIVSAGDDNAPAVSKSSAAAKALRGVFPNRKIAVYGIDIQDKLGGETNVHNRALRNISAFEFLHIEMSESVRTELVENQGTANRFYRALAVLLGESAK